jgi:hypothetical protein
MTLLLRFASWVAVAALLAGCAGPAPQSTADGSSGAKDCVLKTGSNICRKPAGGE